MLILVPLRMITIMIKRCGAFVFGLCHENKYKNAYNCLYLGICEHDQFMLGQIEHKTSIFCLMGWVLCAVLWEASSCALLLV